MVKVLKVACMCLCYCTANTSVKVLKVTALMRDFHAGHPKDEHCIYYLQSDR